MFMDAKWAAKMVGFFIFRNLIVQERDCFSDDMIPFDLDTGM